jgi:myosin heavy subunit
LEHTGVNSKSRRRVPEDDVSQGSTEYRAKFAAPHPSSEGEVIRLELERQLSVFLAAQTERDHRIAQLTDELALKSALPERDEANAVKEQRDVELVDIQTRLRNTEAKLDELLLSRDQQIRQMGQYEKEVANVRTKLEEKESELEAVRLRLAEAEKGLTKSKTEADTLRAQSATGSTNRDEDQVTRRLMECVRAIEAEMASKWWNEKSIEEMEDRNEG